MSEIVRPRLNEEEMNEQINAVKAIAELTAKISELTEQMKGKTCREAYQNSVKNLETKNEKYGKEKVTLTDEEKRVMKEASQKALNKFRAEKGFTVSPSSNEGESNDGSIPEVSEDTMGKQKKGRR